MSTKFAKTVGVLGLGITACVVFTAATSLPSATTTSSTSVPTRSGPDETSAAAGTYADPKTWGETSFVGAVHLDVNNGYFISKFTGSASAHNWYFPAPGQSNGKWTWAGRQAGTYTKPKQWGDVSYVGAVHIGNVRGYFLSQFAGSASDHDWYFPAPGKSDSHWVWAGDHTGTYSDPKQWGDTSYKGAVHIGDKGGYFLSRFDGSASGHNWYFPAPGQSNSYWTWVGWHAGTFADPKDWREASYVGAIHGRGYSGRYVSKFNGTAGPNDYFPVYANQGETENAKWRTLAIQCPVLSAKTQADTRPPASKEGTMALHTVFGLVQKRAKRRSADALSLSLPFESARYKGDAVTTADVFDNRKEKVGSIILAMAPDGRSVAFSDTPGARGIFVTLTAGDTRFIEEAAYDWSTPDTVEPSKAVGSATLATDRSSVDCAGKTVVDVLIGMSNAALEKLGTYHEGVLYALGQLETANTGLRNSHVDVRLRMAGFVTTTNNYAITGANLNKMNAVFGPAMSSKGADLLASFFAPQSVDTAIAWAQIGGRFEMGSVLSPTAYRHEAGHNAGGSHCNDGSNSYAFGYSHAHHGEAASTFLCGNNVPFYSTPLVRDAEGHPYGDASKADMARVWRERANVMSSYERAKTPVAGAIP